MNIAVGSIMHESNTFTPAVTDIESFKRTQYLEGEDMFRYHRNQRSEIGGVLKVLAERHVTVIPTLSALAMPGGRVTAGTYTLLKDRLVEGIRKNKKGLDGVLVSLHGSMSSDGIEDVEGDLLQAIRGVLGPGTPLAATLDHHANVSNAMVQAVDFFVSYRTHPHVDQYEVGLAAAGLLFTLIDEKPVLAKSFVKLPLITPGENRSEPVRKMAAEIEKIEEDPAVFTSSYCVGYPWADVSIIGASVLAVTRSDRERADSCARRLAEKMWSLRADFRFPMYSIEEAVRENAESDKPVLLDELCDCTLGGSSGDVVTSVRYLVENGVKNSIAVGIVDPESAAKAFEAGEGATVRLSIGGKLCTEGNPPLDFTGKVRKTGVNVSGKGSVHAGYETQIGKVAVVERGGVQIVLIEKAGKIDGSSFLEALGIDPKEKSFIVSKEGLNPFVTYRDVASKIVMVDSPGFDRQILRAGDYKNVPRPIYPLDPDMQWSPDTR